VPHIVRELSGKIQEISECLESGHPVVTDWWQNDSVSVIVINAI